MIVFACMFFFCYMTLAMVLTNHTCWKMDALALNIEMLRNDTDGDNLTSRIDTRLVSIINESIDLFDWLDEVQMLLRIQFLVEFSLLSTILCVTLYTLMIDPFGSYAAYTMILIPPFQLFFYCWMGSRVIVGIEKLSTVYDVEWYTMSVRQQKDLLMILMRFQSAKGFNGVFHEVNMETFQKVCRSTFYELISELITNFIYTIRSWSLRVHC